MFTGIIEAIGKVVGTSRRGGILRLTIDLGACNEEVRVGHSVAIDGACLTVAELEGTRATFDVSAETGRLTTIGERRTGDPVNVERPLKVGDRLGGHFVQGHVDGIGSLARRNDSGEDAVMGFRVAPALASQIILKGSVAVDGISLTVTRLEVDGFEVAVIPHTLRNTTLGQKRVGGTVNVEVDMIGKYVRLLVGQTFLSAKQSAADQGVTERMLEQHGFK